MRLLLLLFSLVAVGFSLNYLIYSPIIWHSHANYLAKMADVLSDAGHNVTVVMPVVYQPVRDKTLHVSTKDIIKVDLSREANELGNKAVALFSGGNTWTDEHDPLKTIEAFTKLSDMLVQVCRELLTNEELVKMLRDRHFDLGITEPIAVCGFGLFDHVGIPATIGALSMTPSDLVSTLIGQPLTPSYVPGVLSTKGDKMSMLERFRNAYEMNTYVRTVGIMYETEQSMMRDVLGSSVRTVQEMFSSMTFQLINSNPLLDFPFPTIQKNVAVGGFQVDLKEKAELPEKWNSILNERPQTVYISFGSVARSVEMPDENKSSLLSVFSYMKNTTFIWKYEDENSDIVSHLPNVHIASWIPQTALLADSRLSLFITHGGLGSTTELAHLGKPSIMIPLFADQVRNSFMLERHGGAKVLGRYDLSRKEVLMEAIREVIEDPSYAANATRLSKMLGDQPFSAREMVLKHCEFAAKYGRLPKLDPYGRNLSFVEYYFLDIVTIFVSVLIVSFLVLKFVFDWICCKKQKQELCIHRKKIYCY